MRLPHSALVTASWLERDSSSSVSSGRSPHIIDDILSCGNETWFRSEHKMPFLLLSPSSIRFKFNRSFNVREVVGCCWFDSCSCRLILTFDANLRSKEQNVERNYKQNWNVSDGTRCAGGPEMFGVVFPAILPICKVWDVRLLCTPASSEKPKIDSGSGMMIPQEIFDSPHQCLKEIFGNASSSAEQPTANQRFGLWCHISFSATV